MLLWWLMAAVLVGTFAFAVPYVITRYNLLDTLKAALENIGTEMARKVLRERLKTLVKKRRQSIKLSGFS